MPKLRTRSFALCALAAGAFGVAALPAAAETVKIQRSIPFGSTAQVPAAVKDSCQLQTKVPEFVKEAAGGSVELVDGPLNRNVGRVLEMQITEVHAPGGGAFGAFKGTCSIIGRCTKALGQDIATWLTAPTQNAEIGDAR